MTTSESTSDSDRKRLPGNAQQQEASTDTNGPAASAVAQSIPRRREDPALSLARATNRLASSPSSVPRSLFLEEAANNNSNSAGDEENMSDVGSFQQRASQSLDKAVAVRRLKRHLVTLTDQSTEMARETAAAADTLTSLAREQQQVLGEVEDGYAGD
ncbi:hypothetical protein EV175_005473, partial [Coemansia sp. RSA 1933]